VAKQGISQSAYAKHRGVTPGTVSNAKKRGWLVLYPDGSVNVAASDARWEASKNPLTKPRQARNPLAKLVAKANPAPAPSASGVLVSHKAEHEKLKQRKTELQIAELEGALVSREHAERVIYAVLRVARDKALNIPARVADELSAVDNAREIRTILTREIRDALDVPEIAFDELLARYEQ